MIANEQVPRGKGIVQIFAIFLLAMVGGFLGGELSKANMLASPVRRLCATPSLAAGTPRQHANSYSILAGRAAEREGRQVLREVLLSIQPQEDRRQLELNLRRELEGSRLSASE